MLSSDAVRELVRELEGFFDSECVSHAKHHGSVVEPQADRIIKDIGRLRGIEETVNLAKRVLRKLEAKQ